MIGLLWSRLIQEVWQTEECLFDDAKASKRMSGMYTWLVSAEILLVFKSLKTELKVGSFRLTLGPIAYHTAGSCQKKKV